MKKKTIEWTALVVSIGILAFSIYALVTSINADSKQYYNSLKSSINMSYADMNIQHDYIETIIAAYKGSEELQSLLFEPTSMISDETISGPAQKRIQELLGLSDNSEDIYGFGYHDTREDIYLTGTTVSILNVTEETSYRYQAHFSADASDVPVGGFWWVLVDTDGNERFRYDDFTTSFQDKVTLEPGVYFLYHDFDNLPNGINLTLTFN
ncbi:MAG: hypothetical protein PF505_13715 [Vallitaleaceae bacterium]|jgi:hypothetical protein|nr:hypothetical protein [Vallitaleaceae bacterium]